MDWGLCIGILISFPVLSLRAAPIPCSETLGTFQGLPFWWDMIWTFSLSNCKGEGLGPSSLPLTTTLFRQRLFSLDPHTWSERWELSFPPPLPPIVLSLPTYLCDCPSRSTSLSLPPACPCPSGFMKSETMSVLFSAVSPAPPTVLGLSALLKINESMIEIPQPQDCLPDLGQLISLPFPRPSSQDCRRPWEPVTYLLDSGGLATLRSILSQAEPAVCPRRDTWPCDMDQSQFNLQFTNGHLGEESPAQNLTVKTIINNILPFFFFFGKECGLSQQLQKRNECEMNVKPYLHCFDSFWDLSWCHQNIFVYFVVCLYILLCVIFMFSIAACAHCPVLTVCVLFLFFFSFLKHDPLIFGYLCKQQT